MRPMCSPSVPLDSDVRPDDGAVMGKRLFLGSLFHPALANRLSVLFFKVLRRLPIPTPISDLHDLANAVLVASEELERVRIREHPGRPETLFIGHQMVVSDDLNFLDDLEANHVDIPKHLAQPVHLLIYMELPGELWLGRLFRSHFAQTSTGSPCWQAPHTGGVMV